MTHGSGYASPDGRGEGTAAALPDRRVFWQWVWSAVRPVLGWVLVLFGAAALFAGWYGVSGEALTAKQLPYLVSGGLSGVALVVLAAAFLATEDFRRQIDRVNALETKIDDLHRLFVAELAAPTVATAEPTGTSAPAATSPLASAGVAAIVALPGGTSYHLRDCSLVRGKSGMTPVDATAIEERSLRPCRVCDPPRVG